MIVDAIKRANRPGAPEHSVSLRVAAAGSVLVGIAACKAEGELSTELTVVSMVLVAVGTAFSYKTRERPRGWVKPVLALAVVAAFIWFFVQISRSGGVADISEVEGPLAALFVWVQVTHAFDVPARKDLAFSLAGSASLMAVAAAQAIDLTFAWYVAAWICFGLWGLFAMWASANGGGRMRTSTRVAAVVAVAAVAGCALVVLPAPRVSGNISFPSSAASDSVLAQAGTLAGDGTNPAEPARPGTTKGRTRVGGYLGFAGKLNTSLRSSLGNELVMRVRAERPSYWIGETFDTWNGQAWTATHSHLQEEKTGSPFVIPGAAGSPQFPQSGQPQSGYMPGSQQDLQTFYIAQSGPNMIFHAADPDEVWFPSGDLYTDSNTSTIISPLAMGPGTIYTVESDITQASPRALATDTQAPTANVPGSMPGEYLQLPHPYTRAEDLAKTVTAHDTTTYSKVESLIAWIGAHTHYSTNIPPLPKGADTVDEFLFGTRTGFCEQISTSLAVMLRSIGVPAREAVGYVPDQFDPITDLYDVRAKDAHAWVQVWFPGYGWQSFDPTAVVPDANPSPGATILHDVGKRLASAPFLLAAISLAGTGILAGAVVLTVRLRRRRPATWAEKVARKIEREGKKAGRRRRPEETLSEYAQALDLQAGDASGTYGSLAWMVEQSAYGGHEPDEDAKLAATTSPGRTSG